MVTSTGRRAQRRGVRESDRAQPAEAEGAEAPAAEARSHRNRPDGSRTDESPADGDLADEDFAGFVRRCGTRLTRFAYLLVGDVGQAGDLVQTALVKTWPRCAHVTVDGREAYVR